jgi:hypothetical protein
LPQPITRVSCAIAGSDLHVVAVSGDGGLFHTILSNGNWQAFGNVKGQVGDKGRLVDVACAVTGKDGTTGLDLHVTSVITDGSMWLTARRADGTWSALENVRAANRVAIPALDITSVPVIAAAAGGGYAWHGFFEGVTWNSSR